jgi:hypothetical protein
MSMMQTSKPRHLAEQSEVESQNLKRGKYDHTKCRRETRGTWSLCALGCNT